jgi:hypothetical protein
MRKLRFQFSIRILLAVVTVVCIALGVWGIIPGERQRRAVKAIEAAGGWAHYGYNYRKPERYLRRWLPRDYFDDVEAVSLGHTEATDDVLVHVQGLEHLTFLHLAKTKITDAGLARLEGLKSLQELALDRTQVTNAGLAHLKGLTRLEFLSLDYTQVTDEGIARLRKVLPNCKISTSP